MTDIKSKLLDIIIYCNKEKKALEKEFHQCVMYEDNCKTELEALEEAESFCSLFTSKFLTINKNLDVNKEQK